MNPMLTIDRRNRVLERLAILPVALVLAALEGGCVAQQQRDMAAARDAYDRCVSAHADRPAECEALKQRYLAAQRRYEDDARRAWSCDPAQDECPTPR